MLSPQPSHASIAKPLILAEPLTAPLTIQRASKLTVFNSTENRLSLSPCLCSLRVQQDLARSTHRSLCGISPSLSRSISTRTRSPRVTVGSSPVILFDIVASSEDVSAGREFVYIRAFPPFYLLLSFFLLHSFIRCFWILVLFFVFPLYIFLLSGLMIMNMTSLSSSYFWNTT